MAEREVVFRIHAVLRMDERHISEDDVLAIVEGRDVIEEYPDAYPYPCELILGWASARPLHVVVGYHSSRPITFIVTVYEPDPTEWQPDLRHRKQQ